MKAKEVDKIYIKKMRQMDGNQRVKIAADTYDTAYRIVEASVKNQNPDINTTDMVKLIRQRINR